MHAEGTLAYIACVSCGLVRRDPLPSPAELAPAYSHAYYETGRHDVADFDAAVARLEKKGSYERKEKYAREITPFISASSKVLEIGCGWGSLLKFLSNTAHCAVEGVEPSELASEVAREHYKLPVTTGTLEDFAASRARYDAILMVHVLEHFREPLDTLRRVNTLLATDGVLYIAVPNIMKPDEPLDRFFHAEHLYYFSPGTLSRMLEKVGFELLFFNRRSSDTRLVACRKGERASRLRIARKDGNEGSTFRLAQRVLSRQRRKYAVLRVLRGAARSVLPLSWFMGVRKTAVTLLRRVGVIKT